MNPYLQLKADPELRSIIQHLVDVMLENMNAPGEYYSAQDVRDCEIILDEYLKLSADCCNSGAYSDIVRKTIERLNELNKKTRQSLIEAMEHEMITDFIQKSGKSLGFEVRNEDLSRLSSTR